VFNRERLTELKAAQRLCNAEIVTAMKKATGLTVNVNTITNWERGLSEPRASMLMALAIALNVQVTEFLTPRVLN